MLARMCTTKRTTDQKLRRGRENRDKLHTPLLVVFALYACTQTPRQK